MGLVFNLEQWFVFTRGSDGQYCMEGCYKKGPKEGIEGF